MNFEQLRNIMKSSYEDNNKAEKRLKDSGYTLDKSLSGNRAKVFVDDNGDAFIVHRGTNTIQDVFTDVGLLFGKKNSNQLKHAKHVRKQAEEKYGTVNSIGHSLGGFLAENSGNKTGKVITYNKASVGQKTNNPNQIDIRTKYDIPSILTPKGNNNITLKNKSLNPLIEHSTKALGREKKRLIYY